MTAVKRRHNAVPKVDLMAATLNMVPVSPEMQKFLQAYGVEQHMMAYFNREEPNRYEMLWITNRSTFNLEKN